MILALTSLDSGDIVSASLDRLRSSVSGLATVDMASLAQKSSLTLNGDGCYQLLLAGGDECTRFPNADICINRAFITVGTLKSGAEDGSDFGEILFFHDGANVCFAAHSHVIKSGIPEQMLDEAVLASMRSYQ